MNKFEIHAGYMSGAIGRVAEMHARYYAANWNFGHFFEAKVATELSEFITRFDSKQDGFWLVQQNGQIEGAITIDGIHADTEGAHLRWFILSDKLRGQGFGNKLMAEATSYCRSRNYGEIYLWTFAGLHAARQLYDKFDFVLTHEQRGAQWGTEVTEQKFVLHL